ncbi:lipid-A-disaccharide synthase [Rhodopila globiformis]|uniref:Lipid-A-disaccharide synthase n=1 Tax=Rhodopila globiformis TaxID=1071 RepID=A0A2S6NKU2_RHOGL|nr:lipid-A-disaccharide synthase [Rhodopila globiformis]PPQ35740.1 lipid-A-disaccharide synthase [Rhodopila globiformis]
MPLVYLITGEQSGDILGARLMHAIRSRRPDVSFAGVGGSAMTAQGLDSLFPLRSLALMGLAEVLPKLFELNRLLRRTVADVQARAPDVVVTIDSPGFTLRVLKALQPTTLKRVHFVAPQVWAWRESRVKHFPGLWDELLCLLPFEPAFFARHNLSARFVGHPVLESGAGAGDAARFRQHHALRPEDTVVTVMPGSRQTEVSRLLPVLEQALKLLPDPVVPVVPLAGPVAEVVRQRTRSWPVRPILVSQDADKYDAFAASAVALTKSGTSTLELALANVPMLVTYRVNPVSYVIARRLIKVKYASILNLLLDREVVPELLQFDSRPDRLAAELHRLLNDPAAVAQQRAGFAQALAMLRPPLGSPSECAAEAVLSLLPAR